MKIMELYIDDENSISKTYSSQQTTQDKMIIRIKKQEPDVDIESRETSNDQDDIVSYTCEFVKKIDEPKSDNNEDDDDDDDEPIDSVRQDENFIYPAITNSDNEDTNDLTWQPPSYTDRVTRKHKKSTYPKVDKSLVKKTKYKDNKNETVKLLKKNRLPKNNKDVLQDISIEHVSKSTVDLDTPVVTLNSKLIKNDCDSPTTKVPKPRKGMATPKQRLGRILKIHKMMK